MHCGWIYIWIHEDLLAGTCTAVTDPGEVPAPPPLFLDQTGDGNSSETLLKVFTSKSGPVYNFRTTLIFSLTEAKR